MPKFISEIEEKNAKATVTRSDRLYAIPKHTRVDYESSAAALDGRQFLASADGRSFAEVVRGVRHDQYLVVHSQVDLPPVPFVHSEGRGAPKIISVSENGVLIWASRAMQTGLFEISDEGIFFRTELDSCDGAISGLKTIVFGLHVTDGIRRRRFVWAGSWDVLDDTLYHNVVTGTWEPQETGLFPLPDGRLLRVSRTRKGWERTVIGNDRCEKTSLTYAASARSHLLTSGFIDILNHGQTYTLIRAGKSEVLTGTVERSWQAPDGSCVLLLEALPGDDDVTHRRRLVRLGADGSRKIVSQGHMCMDPGAVSWSSTGEFAAKVRWFEERTEIGRTYRDKLYVSSGSAPIAMLDASIHIRDVLVGDDGNVAAHVVADPAAKCVHVIAKGKKFGPYPFAWNLSFDGDGGIAFNVHTHIDVRRVVI